MEPSWLLSRVEDTAALCRKADCPKFLGFLSENEAALAAAFLRKTDVRFAFFGGYENADRVMLGCLPDWCETPDFPVAAVTFRFRASEKPAHRDFLGAFMSLGVKRETIGDILTEPGRAVVFATPEIAGYLAEQIRKVGGTGVSAQTGFSLPLPVGDEREERSATASSLRLDCVVSALCGFSRNTAKEAVEQGTVFLNGIACDKTTKTVREGDVLTVRRKGKFIIGDLSGKTKKDRVIVHYQQYIRRS